MSLNEENAERRREADILERIENVKRLIQMESTIMTAKGVRQYARYCQVDKNGQRIGDFTTDLLHNLRDEIQLQLLSIVALCYGDNPDLGEPMPVLEWKTGGDGPHPEDRFREMWDECLTWNA